MEDLCRNNARSESPEASETSTPGQTLTSASNTPAPGTSEGQTATTAQSQSSEPTPLWRPDTQTEPPTYRPSGPPPLSPEEEQRIRRRKRCYHRVMSGLEKGGDFRVVLLTSSPASVNDIQTDYRRLMAKLKRLGVVTAYVRVIEHTDSGLQHIHAVWRGRFIPQPLLSLYWEVIHQAPIVRIKKLWGGKRGKSRVGSYFAKYMAKEASRRYSWDWHWVYKAFVAVWRLCKALSYQANDYVHYDQWFTQFLDMWQAHLRSGQDPQRLIDLCNLRLQLARRLSFQGVGL